MHAISTAQARMSVPLRDLAKERPHAVLPFIAQPLLQPHSNEVFGYEVLYRGPHPADKNWRAIDESVLAHLAQTKMTAPLFVNLSNDTILTIDEEVLFAVHHKNIVYFEWSEALSDERKFRSVIDKINDWTKRGLRFVIDDFGAGRDGFERLFAVERVTAVKFDGGFFNTALNNPMASKMLEHIVAECANRNILTVGECIETEMGYRFAASLGLDLAQGYFIDDLYFAAVGPTSARQSFVL